MYRAISLIFQIIQAILFLPITWLLKILILPLKFYRVYNICTIAPPSLFFKMSPNLFSRTLSALKMNSNCFYIRFHKIFIRNHCPGNFP
jgi:hypothetical protein